MSVQSLFLKLNNQLFDLSTPVVMGILNVTPDSFYAGNRFTTDKGILHQAERILSEGGKIIDIGGYSTRPTAEQISQDDEIKRISDALEIVLKKFPDAIISVDTFRSGVANHVVRNYRVALINDVSGGTLDDLMFETIANLDVAYVLMHMRGTPQTMQQLTNYDDVVSEVLFFLERKLAQLRLLGVNDVIVDPGFGFAKTVDQNFQLLNKLTYFQALNVPVLAGLSRKSMLYKLLETDAEHSLNATTAANMLALHGGAKILRVHDVKEAVEAITVFNKFTASEI
jgi:dihydropteroate synthase